MGPDGDEGPQERKRQQTAQLQSTQKVPPDMLPPMIHLTGSGLTGFDAWKLSAKHGLLYCRVEIANPRVPPCKGQFNLWLHLAMSCSCSDT